MATECSLVKLYVLLVSCVTLQVRLSFLCGVLGIASE